MTSTISIMEMTDCIKNSILNPNRHSEMTKPQAEKTSIK